MIDSAEGDEREETEAPTESDVAQELKEKFEAVLGTESVSQQGE